MNTIYKSRFSLLCLMLFSAIMLQAQPVLQIRGYNKLYLLDIESGAESLLYTSPYPEIRTAKVSPDGTLFALQEVDYSSGSGGVNRLKVFNAKGTLLYEGRPDVRKYTWDPKSNRLAYITGTFSEGEVSFIPTGFYLNDFLLNKETRIATDGFKPVGLNWVNNVTEDAIYVECLSEDKAKRFLRYNLLREAFETIPFRSIEVSPDGKYYVDHDASCKCVKIYDRATQVERSRVTLSETDIPTGWMFNANHLFVVAKYTFNKAEHKVVIDGKPKTVSLNESIREGTIVVLDGNNGQQVQTISGVLPSQPPYQSMFAKPDVILSLSPSAAENARQAIGRSTITITAIPEQYRQ